MNKARDITGQTFNKLTAIRRIERQVGQKDTLWECSCACGNKATIRLSSLTGGHTKSCGCAKSAALTSPLLHGLGRSYYRKKEHRTWSAIKGRCLSLTNKDYPTYGGAGIGVSDKWLGRDGFANFLTDMGKCPEGNTSIDRINSRKGYSKENCRWADDLQQANNTSGNRPFTIGDRTQNVSQWAREFGINRHTLSGRIERNWPLEKLSLKPHE